ncbi:relaxase/mobilization nuclease domain-containing protein [Sphingomonas aestuarii]
MIIKLIPSKNSAKGVERYARYLASYMADGDRRWLKEDAIGIDYGLTLSTYINGAPRAPESAPERVLSRGAVVGGETPDWKSGVEEAERRLTRRNRKVKKPVRHAVMSCPVGEELSETHCADAVATVAKELGCEDAVILWAAHVDTDNFHVHMMFVTVDPDTGGALPFGQGADGRSGYKEAMQRAIARIEHKRQLRPEAGARYEVVGDEVVRKPQQTHVVQKRAPLRQEVLEWETQSGFASFTRVAQDVAGPILDQASDWQELHAALAPYGMGIRPSVNGGQLYAGEEHVKLSNVDRRHSWGKLRDRLGRYEPSHGVEPDTYVPRILDPAKAETWLVHTRQMRDVSARIDGRVRALLAARDAALGRMEAAVSAYRADLTGFDGDPRVKRDLFAAFPTLRHSAALTIKAAFDARIIAVRALRTAAAGSDDLSAVDMEAIGAVDVGIAAPWHVDNGPPAVASLAEFESERRGDAVCYWSRDDHARRGQPALVDTGAIIWVNDHSDRAVETALKLARDRFGDVAVFGDAAYLARCHRAAQRLGIELETITVVEAQRRARKKRRDLGPTRQRALEARMVNQLRTAERRRWARAYERAAPADDGPMSFSKTQAAADVQHHSVIPTKISKPDIGVRADTPAVTLPTIKWRAAANRNREGDGIK